MKNVAQPATLSGLESRLQALTPQSDRRWGTLTPEEMLCHLADSFESVLGVRVPPGPPSSGRPRPLLKWFILYSPTPWPKGVKTRPGIDPRREGTRPGEFERDKGRAIRGLASLAAAPAEQLNPVHYLVGPMSRKDWRRWAYKHADHHLRQFGL